VARVLVEEASQAYLFLLLWFGDVHGDKRRGAVVIRGFCGRQGRRRGRDRVPLAARTVWRHAGQLPPAITWNHKKKYLKNEKMPEHRFSRLALGKRSVQ